MKFYFKNCLERNHLTVSTLAKTASRLCSFFLIGTFFFVGFYKVFSIFVVFLTKDCKFWKNIYLSMKFADKIWLSDSTFVIWNVGLWKYFLLFLLITQFFFYYYYFFIFQQYQTVIFSFSKSSTFFFVRHVLSIFFLLEIFSQTL